MNILGKVIKQIRQSKSMTQKDLAILTGFKQNTISNHENGKRLLDEEDIMIYAKALGITPQKLFDYNMNHLDTTINNPDETTLIFNYRKLKGPRQQIIYSFTADQLEKQENEFQVHEDIAKFQSDGKPLYPIEVISKVENGIAPAYDANMVTEMFYTDRNDLKPYTFATQTFDDSMVPKIKDGDIILIKQGYDCIDGGIYAVDYKNKPYLKTVYLSDGVFILKSINQKYEDIVVDLPIKEDICLNIVGKVVDWFTPVEK